jgi:hypothetical protein
VTPDTQAAGPVDQGERLQKRPGERRRVVASHLGDSTPMHHKNDNKHCLVLEGAARIVRGDGTFDAPAAVRPVGRPIAGSSLVRRLVLVKDDPAKQRIRAWLSNIDDERLFCLGFIAEDIAALRGTPPAPGEGDKLFLPMPTADSQSRLI